MSIYGFCPRCGRYGKSQQCECVPFEVRDPQRAGQDAWTTVWVNHVRTHTAAAERFCAVADAKGDYEYLRQGGSEAPLHVRRKGYSEVRLIRVEARTEPVYDGWDDGPAVSKDGHEPKETPQ